MVGVTSKESFSSLSLLLVNKFITVHARAFRLIHDVKSLCEVIQLFASS